MVALATRVIGWLAVGLGEDREAIRNHVNAVAGRTLGFVARLPHPSGIFGQSPVDITSTCYAAPTGVRFMSAKASIGACWNMRRRRVGTIRLVKPIPSSAT